ncbi:MAG TPA: hypothetical protein VFU49_20845, partial [Ktedonobacteraceae bacterium]|nr:hypothetical protein [Ktedonobacteraceae bacterium]
MLAFRTDQLQRVQFIERVPARTMTPSTASTTGRTGAQADALQAGRYEVIAFSAVKAAHGKTKKPCYQVMGKLT